MVESNRIEKHEDTEEKYLTDSPTHPNRETGKLPERGVPPRTPQWVKVFAIIAILLLLLFVIMQVISGGEHGPRRHSSSRSDPGGYTSYSRVIQDYTLSSGDPGGDTSYSRVTQDYTLSSGDPGGQTPLSNIIEQRVQSR